MPTDQERAARILGIELPKDSPRRVPKGKAPSRRESVNDEAARILGINPVPADAPAVPVPKAAPEQQPVAAAAPRDAANPLRGRVGTPEQMIEGMPIIGPMYQRGQAAFAATVDPLAGRGRGEGWPRRYGRNLDWIREANKEYAEENPARSLASNLTGGLMAAAPVGMTKVGGALLGGYGPSLGSRVVTGGIGGGAIGTTDAALRGESPYTGGVLGMTGGAGAPFVGEGARKITNTLLNWKNRVFGPETPISKIPASGVAKLIEAARGETPSSFRAAEQRMGPAGFVSDINPQFTDIAGAIADMPGPGKPIVRGAYEGRMAGQRERIEAGLDKAIGPSRDIQALKSSIIDERARVADPLYEQWRKATVQPTDELRALMPRLEKAGAFDLAEELSGVSGRPVTKAHFTGGPDKQFPTTESWDYVKRGLDRAIDRAYSGNDKTLARELIKLKREMIDEIEKTDAGKIWKKARTEFAERSALLDQIDAGRDTFLGGRSGLSVDELREELATLSRPELAARLVGLRAAAREAMGASAQGDTIFRNKLRAPNNREKMDLMLGDKKAKELADLMEQEFYLGEQTKNVVGNVMTGASGPARSQRIQAMQRPPVEPWDLDVTRPGTYVPPFIRREFSPSNILNAWRGQGDVEAAHALAPLMVTRAGTPEYRETMRALRRETARRAVTDRDAERFGSALSRLIAVPSMTPAGRKYVQ